jgi:hypothetical protein
VKHDNEKMTGAMNQLEVSKKKTGDEVWISLAGPISGESEFPDLSADQMSSLTLYLAKIDHINSRGLGKWMNWFNVLKRGRPGLSIFLERVPLVLVKQIVSVGRFIPEGTKIRSFQVPYYCENCDAEDYVWLSEGEHYFSDGSKLLGFPQKPCLTCKKPLDLDIQPNLITEGLAPFGVKFDSK